MSSFFPPDFNLQFPIFLLLSFFPLLSDAHWATRVLRDRGRPVLSNASENSAMKSIHSFLRGSLSIFLFKSCQLEERPVAN